jgi:hypothetical protein
MEPNPSISASDSGLALLQRAEELLEMANRKPELRPELN